LNFTELPEGDHVLVFSFQIVGDAVGWGFVVRGSKPCHIQAVDPSGPAAAAGMKVGFQTRAIYRGYLCSSAKVSVKVSGKAACTRGGRGAFVCKVEDRCVSLRPSRTVSAAAFHSLLFLFFCP